MSKYSTALTRKIRRSAWTYADKLYVPAALAAAAALYMGACLI